MRALAFLATLLATLPLGFVAPYAGVLLWCWLSFMSPHQLIFFSGIPVVYIAAIVTAVGLVMSKEPKRLPANLAPWLLLLFMLWTTVTTLFALDQASAWLEWDRNEKTFLLALTIMVVMNTRVRLHALAWVIVLSVAYFSLKGGLSVLLTGGGSHIHGLDGTVTGDNNNLGLIMVMSWSLINYLRLNSESKLVRSGLFALMGLTILAVLGTYSRGAFVALVPTLSYFWWKAKRKVIIGIIGVVAVIPAIIFMPQAWVERMDTIQTYDQDGSAMARIRQWGFAMALARDHPLVGGGFDASQSYNVVKNYYPDQVPRAYHSIWFEALGDHGIPGLLIFIAIGLVSLHNAGVIRRATRTRPEWAWAHDFATMSQVSLAGYYVAGSFLSMAYYDCYFALVAMLAILRDIVAKRAEVAAPIDSRASNIAPAPLTSGYAAVGKEWST